MTGLEKLKNAFSGTTIQPTTGLDKLKLAIQNQVPLATPMAQSTVAVAPQEGGILSSLGGIAKGFGKGIVEMYTKPSQEVQQIEKLLIPEKSFGTAVSKPIAQAIVRTFAPFVAPYGKDLGERILLNEIMPKVESGEMPMEVLNQIDILNKTAPQIVGDAATAVLTAYSPTIFGKRAFAFKNAPIKSALIGGGIRGATTGLGFGGAQVLSSGIKDPVEASKILAGNIVAMGVLGTITSGAIPVAKEVKDRVIQFQNKLQQDFIARGYSPEEALQLAQQGGYVGGIPSKEKPQEKVGGLPEIPILAKEVRQYKSALPKEIQNLPLTDRIPSNQLIRKPTTGEIYFKGKLIKKFDTADEAFKWLYSIENNPNYQKLLEVNKRITELKTGQAPELLVQQAKTFNDIATVSKTKYPQTVYHGTQASSMVKFDKTKLGKSGVIGATKTELESGFWLTSNKVEAGTWGDNIVEAKVNIKNPLIIKDPDLMTTGGTQRMSAISEMEGGGYDSLILRDEINKIDWIFIPAEEANKIITKDFYNQAVGGVKGVAPKAAVNIERLNIPQKAKQQIIKASEEIKPQLEAVKGKVLSNNEVIEAAQSSEILRRGTTREATLKSEAALLKTREHLAELAKNEKLTPEFIDTLRTVSAEATRRGRELQALGIEADPVLGTVKAKLVKQLLDMGIETEKIITASKGIDFNNAQQVMKFFREFVKPTLPQIIDEYRYINMLSSPKTQIVNTFSNLLQATVLRPVTRLASGVVDTFRHILTGKEQEFYIKQVPVYYKGAFNSLGDALSEFMRVMKGQQQIYRPDIRNIPTGVKVFKPFQVIPRLMEASDVFFRKIISGGEIEAMMSKGVSETEAVNMASKNAEELVFRKALDPANKTGQGILLSKIDALTTAVYKLRNVPGVKWFIPFVQTPMNILKQGIEYSPLGISTLAENTAKIEQFGKTLVGTTIFAGAGWLALKDRTTWAVPINQKEKDAFYATGMRPYSIKMGDTWVSYSQLGPIAYPIAMATAIKFYTKDNPKAVGDTELQKITKIISGIAQFFSDQSYVQGIGDFVNMAQGDVTALTRAASQIPSQLIPLTALQRWVANIIDPIYRKTEKKLSIEGIIENLKSGIPGLTTTIPPYTTPIGEPSQRQYPFLNPLIPISVSEENPEWRDFFNTLQQVSRENVLGTKSKEELKQSAQDLYDKMKVLPKDEAKRQFDDLIKNNPDLAKQVSDLATEVKLDYKESFLKSLGVENEQRAKYVVQELNKLKTKEEKRSYYQNLMDKKVITKQVNEQVLKLLK